MRGGRWYLASITAPLSSKTLTHSVCPRTAAR
jgi:hypothetical protein